MPVRQRVLVKQVCYNYKLSERRVCKILSVQRSSFYYRSVASEQAALTLRIKEISSVRVRYGYRRIHTLLQREGWQVNHKRVYRLYKREGLQMRNKIPRGGGQR
jgi:putative transposase